MVRSTANIATDRADRYRDQLARHGAGMMRQTSERDAEHATAMQDISELDEGLVLHLAWGRCTVTATDESLVLVAESETADGLARIQAGVGQRVTKIGRRDGLSVTWETVEGDPSSERSAQLPRGRRGLIGVVVMMALVAVMILVHVGAAAFLVRQHWTWWAVAVIAVVLGAKLLLAHRFASVIRMHLPGRSSAHGGTPHAP